MASHVTSADIPANGEHLAAKHARKIQIVSLLVFLVGGAASAAMFFGVFGGEWHESFSYSWLFGFAFFLTLALGGCFWTLLHTLTNSGWGVAVRRLMENLGLVFPCLLLIALPLLLPDVQEHLFEWMNKHRSATGTLFSKPNTYQLGSEGHHGEWLLAAKNFYMNIPFWYARTFAFFGLLGGAIWYLRKLSIEQDSLGEPDKRTAVSKVVDMFFFFTGGFVWWSLNKFCIMLSGLFANKDADAEEKGFARLIQSRRLSSAMMVIFAISATFLAFDFIMGLDFTWFSTMWGVYFFAGCAINSMAVLILTLTWLRSKGYLKVVTSEEHYHIMGKLMHAFVIFWAYVTFSQFMLIWYAAIPEETRFFILRNTGEWNVPSICLVICHFAIPFVALLPHYVKKKTILIVPVCIYLLAVHILDLYIMIVPERGPSLTAMNEYSHNLSGIAGKHGVTEASASAPEGIQLFVNHSAWMGDVLAFVTVGAFFLFVFITILTRASLFPNRDPRILESANLHG